MDKIQLSQILVKGGTLKAIQLIEEDVADLINETKQRQIELLELAKVDLESLKTVINL